jgi:hypothetical protein
MGDVQGPEKVNDTCLKTTHVGTLDRGLYLLQVHLYLSQEEAHYTFLMNTFQTADNSLIKLLHIADFAGHFTLQKPLCKYFAN